MKRFIGGKLFTPRRGGFGSIFSTMSDMKLADRLAREATTEAKRGNCQEAHRLAERASALVPAAGGKRGQALLATIDYAREAADTCSAGFSGYKKKRRGAKQQIRRGAKQPVKRVTLGRFGHLFGRR